MYSPASIKGHPLHPMLITIPIGLWIFSLASDIIHLGRLAAGPWAEIAFYSMAAGIVGALLAALPGLVDLFSISDPRMKRIGIIHMVMNLVIVALYGANWAWRFSRQTELTGPFILSVVSIVLLLISGWLGASWFIGTGWAWPSPACRAAPWVRRDRDAKCLVQRPRAATLGFTPHMAAKKNGNRLRERSWVMVMKGKLHEKRVAILVAEGFEQVELTGPREALEKAGAAVDRVSPAGETVRAWNEKKWGKDFSSGCPVEKGAA